MLLLHYDFPQRLCVGSAYFFGLGRVLLVLRHTESISFEQFSPLILKIRRRFEEPLLFVIMTVTDSEDTSDCHADLERLLHEPCTFMRYTKGLGSACLSSPSSSIDSQTCRDCFRHNHERV